MAATSLVYWYGRQHFSSQEFQIKRRQVQNPWKAPRSHSLEDLRFQAGFGDPWQLGKVCDLNIWGPGKTALPSSQVVRWGYVASSNQWNVSGSDTYYFRAKLLKNCRATFTLCLFLPWRPWRLQDEMLVGRRVPRFQSGVWKGGLTNPYSILLEWDMVFCFCFCFLC